MKIKINQALTGLTHVIAFCSTYFLKLPFLWRSHHTTAMSESTNPEVLRLTEAMTKYCVLFESCSQHIRTIPNKCYKSQLYKEAVAKWQHHSEFYRPPRGNEAARARFFGAVDEACKTESRAPETCVLNSLLQCLSNGVSSQVAI
jgi:hypothetical protein